MKKENKSKTRMPLSLAQNAGLAVLITAVVFAAVYMTYYLIHFMGYKGYVKYLKSYEYEAGSTPEFLKEAESSVPGFKLVAENEKLKLYTDTDTTYIAVYDKRNGSITYSNPLNADEDTVAKSANKNYLKAQLIVSYYNESVASASMDNYSKSIMFHNFTCEGIENGVRYVYSIGERKDVGSETGTYFVIPVEYRLEDDSVVASIPASGIEEHGAGYIYRIQLLRYMAASSYEDEGYIVVPNASGALINFNNGKKSAAQYSQYIYGIDPIAANYTTIENTDDARLPIYALCYRDRSILAIVEGGKTTATLTANVSGTYNDYNFAYPTFVTRNTDNLVMFGNANTDTYIMEEHLYDIDYSVRYCFPESKYTGYSGIANYYRERLISEGRLSPITEEGDIPFYYDIISGVKENSHFLGVKYLHTFGMTDFDEAGEIAKDIAARGVTNQVMNLQGWFNGGYYHDTADRIRVPAKLGGKSGLEELNALIKELDGKLYAEAAFQKVTRADDGYNANAESSRYYGGGYVAAFGQTDPSALRSTGSLGYDETRYYLLSPKFLPRYVGKFADRIVKYDVDGISLRDLGNTLQSDKRRTNITDREQALNIVKSQLEVLENTGRNLMFDSANEYAFDYAHDIINVPTDDNAYFICDESIPLYQMVIHGCIDYSSTLMNYENSLDLERFRLELIETGTAPHYQFTAEEASLMKDTGLNRFYSTTYDVWADTAVETYDYVNKALKFVRNACIVKHVSEGNLRAVTYDNGITVYVNYGAAAGSMNGIEVPAMSYLLTDKNGLKISIEEEGTK